MSVSRAVTIPSNGAIRCLKPSSATRRSTFACAALTCAILAFQVNVRWSTSCLATASVPASDCQRSALICASLALARLSLCRRYHAASFSDSPERARRLAHGCRPPAARANPNPHDSRRGLAPRRPRSAWPALPSNRAGASIAPRATQGHRRRRRWRVERLRRRPGAGGAERAQHGLDQAGTLASPKLLSGTGVGPPRR